MECLKKSLKIADSAKGVDGNTNINLFVEILNQYLFYFENNNEAVSVIHLNKSHTCTNFLGR